MEKRRVSRSSKSFRRSLMRQRNFPHFLHEEDKSDKKRKPLANIFGKKNYTGDLFGQRGSYSDGSIYLSRLVRPSAKMDGKPGQSAVVSRTEEDNLSDSESDEDSEPDQNERTLSSALLRLTENEDSRLKVINGGILATLVTMCLSNDFETRRQVSSSFRNLSEEEMAREIMVMEGVIPALVTLCGCPDPQVKLDCSVTICRLTSVRGCESRIVQDGVTNALLSFGAIPPIQCYCATALFNLSQVYEQYEGIELVSKAVMTLLTTGELCYDASLICIRALCCATALPYHRPKLVSDGIMRLLFKVTRQYSTADMHILCLTMLCNLAFCKSTRSRIVNERAIPILVNLCRSTNIEIRRRCALGLCLLCEDHESRNKILSEGAVSAIFSLCCDSFINGEIAAHCASSLCSLSQLVDSRNWLVDMDIGSSLLSLVHPSVGMEDHIDDEGDDDDVNEELKELNNNKHQPINNKNNKNNDNHSNGSDGEIDETINDEAEADDERDNESLSDSKSDSDSDSDDYSDDAFESTIKSTATGAATTVKSLNLNPKQQNHTKEDNKEPNSSFSVASTYSDLALQTMRNCVHTLANLVSTPSCQPKLIEQGVINLIVRLSKVKDPSLRGYCALCFFNLSCETSSHLHVVQRSDALEAITDLLSEPAIDARKDSTSTVYNLSCPVDNRPHLIKHGIVRSLIEILRLKDERLTSECSAALCNFSRDPETCQSMVDQGVVTILMELAKNHSSETKKWCGALLCGMSFNPTTRQHLVDQGVVGALIELSKLDDQAMKLRCAVALRNISCATFLHNVLISEGAVPVCVKMSHSYNEKIQQHCSATICNLSETVGFEEELFDGGALSGLIVTSLVRSDDVLTKMICLKSLFNLYCYEPRQAHMIEEGIAWAVTVLSRLDSTETKDMCSLALFNLSALNYGRIKIVEEKGTLKALFGLIEGGDLQRKVHCTKTFSNLLFHTGLKNNSETGRNDIDPNVIRRVLEEHGLKAACDLASCKEKAIDCLISPMFLRLAQHEKAAIRLLDSEVLMALQSLAVSNCPCSGRNVALTLLKLSENSLSGERLMRGDMMCALYSLSQRDDDPDLLLICLQVIHNLAMNEANHSDMIEGRVIAILKRFCQSICESANELIGACLALFALTSKPVLLERVVDDGLLAVCQDLFTHGAKLTDSLRQRLIVICSTLVSLPQCLSTLHDQGIVEFICMLSDSIVLDYGTVLDQLKAKRGQTDDGDSTSEFEDSYAENNWENSEPRKSTSHHIDLPSPSSISKNQKHDESFPSISQAFSKSLISLQDGVLRCASALEHVSHLHDTRLEMTKKGVVKTIVKFVKCPSAWLFAGQTLCNLAVVPECARMLIEDKAVPALIMLSDTNIEMKKRCAVALCSLTQETQMLSLIVERGALEAIMKLKEFSDKQAPSISNELAAPNTMPNIPHEFVAACTIQKFEGNIEVPLFKAEWERIGAGSADAEPALPDLPALVTMSPGEDMDLLSHCDDDTFAALKELSQYGLLEKFVMPNDPIETPRASDGVFEELLKLVPRIEPKRQLQAGKLELTVKRPPRPSSQRRTRQRRKKPRGLQGLLEGHLMDGEDSDSSDPDHRTYRSGSTISIQQHQQGSQSPNIGPQSNSSNTPTVPSHQQVPHHTQRRRLSNIAGLDGIRERMELLQTEEVGTSSAPLQSPVTSISVSYQSKPSPLDISSGRATRHSRQSLLSSPLINSNHHLHKRHSNNSNKQYGNNEISLNTKSAPSLPSGYISSSSLAQSARNIAVGGPVKVFRSGRGSNTNTEDFSGRSGGGTSHERERIGNLSSNSSVSESNNTTNTSEGYNNNNNNNANSTNQTNQTTLLPPLSPLSTGGRNSSRLTAGIATEHVQIHVSNDELVENGDNKVYNNNNKTETDLNATTGTAISHLSINSGSGSMRRPNPSSAPSGSGSFGHRRSRELKIPKNSRIGRRIGSATDQDMLALMKGSLAVRLDSPDNKKMAHGDFWNELEKSTMSQPLLSGSIGKRKSSKRGGGRLNRKNSDGYGVKQVNPFASNVLSQLSSQLSPLNKASMNSSLFSQSRFQLSERSLKRKGTGKKRNRRQKAQGSPVSRPQIGSNTNHHHHHDVDQEEDESEQLNTVMHSNSLKSLYGANTFKMAK